MTHFDQFERISTKEQVQGLPFCSLPHQYKHIIVNTMPPKTRRAASGPTAKAGQSTLSFKNRISKPSDSTTNLKNAKSKLNEPAEEIVTSEIVKQSTPEPEHKPTSGKAKAQENESPVRIVPSPSRRRKARRSLNDDDEDTTYEAVEKQAKKTSEAQIKKYWKAEEDSRLAPRGISLSFLDFINNF